MTSVLPALHARGSARKAGDATFRMKPLGNKSGRQCISRKVLMVALHTRRSSPRVRVAQADLLETLCSANLYGGKRNVAIF
jgi:hypothetical protein